MDWLAKYVQKIHVDRALAERNFECLVSLLRDQNTPSDVRDYLADVVLGLLTGKQKRLPIGQQKALRRWQMSAEVVLSGH